MAKTKKVEFKFDPKDARPMSEYEKNTIFGSSGCSGVFAARRFDPVLMDDGKINRVENEHGNFFLASDIQGRLQKVFDVLDEQVGDYDPEIPDDWTDEDVMIEEPLFWCCREIGRIIARPRP